MEEASQSKKELAPHEQRVVDEKRQLDEKISKLADFFSGEIFLSLDHLNRQLLIAQHAMMESYSRILGLRIQLF